MNVGIEAFTLMAFEYGSLTPTLNPAVLKCSTTILIISSDGYESSSLKPTQISVSGARLLGKE